MATHKSIPQNDMAEILQLAKELRQMAGWPDTPTLRTKEDPLRNFEFGAELYGGEHSDSAAKLNKMVAWCTEQFGPRDRGSREDWRWEHNSGKFWFKNEEDRLLFLLAWT